MNYKIKLFDDVRYCTDNNAGEIALQMLQDHGYCLDYAAPSIPDDEVGVNIVLVEETGNEDDPYFWPFSVEEVGDKTNSLTIYGYQFVPAYYEWHLIDKNREVVHNMLDPLDDLLYGDERPMSFDGVLAFCTEQINAANEAYAEDKEYHGIKLDWPLTSEQSEEAASVMAHALYDYYFD